MRFNDNGVAPPRDDQINYIMPERKRAKSLASEKGEIAGRSGMRPRVESRMPSDDFEPDGVVIGKAQGKTKLKRPPLYRVLLHNDDFTSMGFVVFILQTIFSKNESDAVRIMLDVHNQGLGVVGLYPYEIAEMKVAKVTSVAQANEFPLLCTLEEVTD
jgi:ATP-dependent Clp protease adaptor protein ClpS